MTPPIPGRRAALHWPLICTLALGLLAVVVAGLSTGRGAGAFAPGGTPTASRAASPAASPVASPAASPVAGTTADGNGRGSPSSDAVSSITNRIVHSNPILARAKGPVPGDTVFDPYRYLTPDQTRALSGDAQRLRNAGLPTLVYIRISLDNQRQAQEFATSVAQKPGLVESRKGAQDGLVVLISIPPGAPQKGTIAIAHGANALPVNGLDDAAIERIYADEMLPRLRKGEMFPAAEYGLREFNYVVAYSPYSTPVLSSTAQRVGRWLGIAAPLVALAGIALLVLTWFPTGASWRRPVSRDWRAWLATWWPAVIAGGFCAMLIPLGVYARSRIGVFAAALLIFAFLLDVWVTTDHPGRRRGGRRIAVTPTNPATLATRRRTGPQRTQPHRSSGDEGAAV